jgi:3-oxoacyl-[acyl-carrier protein] reductase
VRALAVPTDVTDTAQVEAMVARARAELGPVEVLVNNAGIGPDTQGFFRDYALDAAHRCVDLNFWGTVNCIRAVVEDMVAAKRGSIINISSGAGLDGIPNLPFYSASKAAVIALAQALAKELSPHGICVNAVSPGRIYPSSAEQLGEGSSKRRPRLNVLQNDEASAAAAAAQGRLGHPEDVAAMVVFLASDPARFVTGKTIVVDGGARIDMENKLAATRAAWGLPTGALATA